MIALSWILRIKIKQFFLKQNITSSNQVINNFSNEVPVQFAKITSSQQHYIFMAFPKEMYGETFSNNN